MDDSLLKYYERELTFIRKMGAEYGRKYPKIAGRLQLEPDRCEDPHTERLIEAFALISGRIHKKIDDGFPELTQSLLGILYPHYLNPIPSLSIVRFEPILQNVPETGYRIDRGTRLYSKPVRGTPCRFMTTQSVMLWPVTVSSAELRDPAELVRGAQQAICLDLKTFNEMPVAELQWDSLRFFLNGPAQQVYRLYELILNSTCEVILESTDDRGRRQSRRLGADVVRPVGFDPEQQLLPYTRRSFPGYNLLFEYFCFPEKYLFFDLLSLDKAADMGGNDRLRLWIYLSRTAGSDLAVDADSFALNATPAINLFSKIAEPIRVEHQKTEYAVIPDIRRQEATEVFSIDRVTAISEADSAKEIEYRPFYSIRHHLDRDPPSNPVYWHLERRPAARKDDNGTDVFITFAGQDFKPQDPGVEILTLHTTCTNRDLPARLPFGDPQGDFDMEIEAPVARVHSLIKPTPTRRPQLGGALQWQLISHLSLNYLSLVEGGEAALKEILRLYDFDNSPTTRQQIDGIVSLGTRHVTRRIGRSFCRGVEVTVSFDEEKYIGAGHFLFASVLERFLAQYVSVNSFAQLVARTIQRKEAIKRWPPRSGNHVLL